MNPTIQILTEATHEIRSLRHQNEILRAKVEVMDLFACVLHTQPAQHVQGMSPDIAWQLEQEAARLAEADKTIRTTTEAEAVATESWEKQ